MYKWIIILGIFFFTKNVYCQPNDGSLVKGVFIDSISNKPIINTNGTLKTNNIVYFFKTDDNGNFTTKLKLESQKDIVIKLGSYQDKRIIISKVLSVINLETIILVGNSIALDEVLIKANRRYSDTIHIDLANEKFADKIVIDDLFSKYGFSKDENGKLRYKGKIVSNLLVNGGDFFKNNDNDVYKILPAFILNGIKVVETNIDSITNVTNLRSTVKVNLELKKEYNNGKFGNASSGIGSKDRYLAATALYNYRDKRQFSVLLNSNNINVKDLPLKEPPVGFSANGNNVKANSSNFTYANKIGKYLDLDFVLKGKADYQVFKSESERSDQTIQQFSKTIAQTNSRSYGMPDSRMALKYTIDNANLLTLTQSGKLVATRNSSGLDYLIANDKTRYSSNLSKSQNERDVGLISNLFYRHSFSAKKGRSLNLNVIIEKNKNQNDEVDSIYIFQTTNPRSNYVNISRKITGTVLSLGYEFTEPLTDKSFISFSSLYKLDNLRYKSDIRSDTIVAAFNYPVKINSNTLQSGVKFHKLFNKVTFDGSTVLNLNRRYNEVNELKNSVSFFNIDAELKADYKINLNRDFTLVVSRNSKYPEWAQLLNYNTSYDLISQAGNNLNIKPEIKNSLNATLELRENKFGNINLNAIIEHDVNKIAPTVISQPNQPQIILLDNIGSGFLATMSVGLYKNKTQAFNLNYNSGLTYQRQPVSVNQNVTQNNSLRFNQVISSNFELFNSSLKISPVLTLSYNKIYYDSSIINVTNISYSDKISLSAYKFKMELLPLFNYSRSINSLGSFSMNASLTREIFTTGTLWLQGYDLFNSFQFNNNVVNSVFTQTVKYSNVSRYLIVGLSINFNNMKQ